MDFFELRVPFFRPLWRRWLMLGACFGWAAFEWASGNPLWAAVFCGFGAVALWQFFLLPWPRDD